MNKKISLFAGLAFLCVSVGFADDMKVKLNSTDGSTSFQVRNSNDIVVSTIDSTGNAVFNSASLIGDLRVQGNDIFFGASQTGRKIYDDPVNYVIGLSTNFYVDGRLHISGSIRLSTSANAGYVLTTDEYGVGTWRAATGGGSVTLPINAGGDSNVITSPGDVSVQVDTDNNGNKAFVVRASTGNDIFAAIERSGVNGAGELHLGNYSRRIYDDPTYNVLGFSSDIYVNGKVHSTSFQLGTSATAGRVLTTDEYGVGTWQAASGGGGGWTDGGTVVYPTSASDDVAIGGTDAAAKFFFDTSASSMIVSGRAAFGSDVTINGNINSLSNKQLTFGDVAIGHNSGSYRIDITTNVKVGGYLTVGGDEIRDSGSEKRITLATSLTRITTIYSQVNVQDDLTVEGSLIVGNQASNPSGALPGMIYYNNSSNRLKVYNGAWVDIATGTITGAGGGGGIGGSGTLGTVPRFADSATLGDSSIHDDGTNATATGNLTVQGRGTVSGTPTGTGVSQGTIYINPGSAASDQTLFGIAVGGAERLRFSKEGNLFLYAQIFPGSTTGGTQTARYLADDPNNYVLKISTNLYIDGRVHSTSFRLGISTTTGYVLTTDANGVGTWQAAAGGSSEWTDTGTELKTNEADDDIRVQGGDIFFGTSQTTRKIYDDDTYKCISISTNIWIAGNIQYGEGKEIRNDGDISLRLDANVNGADNTFRIKEGAGNDRLTLTEAGRLWTYEDIQIGGNSLLDSVGTERVAIGSTNILTGAAAGSTVSNGAVYINNTNTTAGRTILGLASNGTEKFKVDNDGDATVANTLTIGNLTSDPTGSEGMLYYNSTSNKLRLHNGTSWVDIATGTVSGGGGGISDGSVESRHLQVKSTATFQTSDADLATNTWTDLPCMYAKLTVDAVPAMIFVDTSFSFYRTTGPGWTKGGGQILVDSTQIAYGEQTGANDSTPAVNLSLTGALRVTSTGTYTIKVQWRSGEAGGAYGTERCYTRSMNAFWVGCN